MNLVVLIAVVGAVHNYVTDHFDMFISQDFAGIARGGDLALVEDHCGSKCGICLIKTDPGSSAAEVVKRLVEACHSSPNRSLRLAAFEGTVIYLPPGGYYITGSETGFAVLPPARFVTANYLPKDDRITVDWVAGERRDEYLTINGSVFIQSGEHTGTASLEGVCTRKRHDTRTETDVAPNPSDLAVCVLKKKWAPGLPLTFRARTARVHVSGTLQEDLDNVPFYGNVGPNWEPWCQAGFQEGDLRLYQGEKSEVPEKKRKLAFASSPETKFYCQMFEIKKDVPAEGGIYRRYLGLIPGHKYRVYARFNTFEASAETGDWSLSFHACADPPGQGLTVNQMAGRDGLPNGATGPEASRIAVFQNGGQTTAGKWARVSTGMEGAPPSAADITIPEGSTSISAWVRVKGSTPNRFGMDWSALEDLTAK